MSTTQTNSRTRKGKLPIHTKQTVQKCRKHKCDLKERDGVVYCPQGGEECVTRILTEAKEPIHGSSRHKGRRRVW